MTSPTGERRVRRPRDKERTFQALTSEGGPFQQLRDAMVFAAAVGWASARRIPFTASGESIRWDTATNRRGTELMVEMLSISVEDDEGQLAEVLSDDLLNNRIGIFEEFVNGGLEVIQEHLDSEIGTPSEIVARMIESSLSARVKQQVPTLSELLNELA